MEYVTEPWQVVFLGVLGLVFCAVLWWWLHRDLPADREIDDAGPVELIGRGWQALLHWRPVPMSSSAGDDRDEDMPDDADDLAVKRNGETAGNAVATVKNEGSDQFQFPDVFTGLARLVLDNKLSETDALKIAVKASPGKSPRYTEARDRLHVAMAHERGAPLFLEDGGRLAPASYPVSGR